MEHVDVRGNGDDVSPTSVAGTCGREASSPLNPVEGEGADMSGVYVPTEVPFGDDAEMSVFPGPTELPCDSPTDVAPDESH